jgi:type IV pilus assembly protein PilY1
MKVHAKSSLLARALLLLSSMSVAGSALAALAPGGSVAAASDYEAQPPQVVQGADPFLMINLSVELTQQAESFTDGAQTYANGTYCPGRATINNPAALGGGTRQVGACYSSAETYIGYFDPGKCYVYDTTGANTVRTQLATGPRSDVNAHYFRPIGAASATRTCTNAFSGNFMNWATMTALDQFRSAMTGGARLVDTAGGNARTLLVRTHRYDDWPFIRKAISGAGITIGTGVNRRTFTNAVNGVTPFNTATLHIFNNWSDIGGVTGQSGNRVRFYDANGTLLGQYNVIVQVCDPGRGLESNCVRYTNADGSEVWYKPEGLLQKNALKMRYALNSYTAVSGNGVNGGVLRSYAKYIGYLRPRDDGGVEVNPEAEINEDGTYVFDPQALSGTVGGVVNSGILNYINQFGLAAGRYKSNDPVAELYYEGLRYMMGLPPTPSFTPANAHTVAVSDGYPILNSPAGWAANDPIANACQKNYALYVGDQFAHADNYLPGLACTTECADVPAGLNANALTNTVGTKQNFFAGTLGGQTRGRGDGYWIAGLAYWAATNDIRPTVEGRQRVKTFMVDTQEYSANPPTGQNNQLWLAAKFGGFNDLNNDEPNNDALPTLEWDANGDGVPDGYTLASQPANLVAGLTQAFNEVLEKSSSASAAAVVANASRGTGAIYQAIYEPRIAEGNTVVTWTGLLRGLFIDDRARIREDTDGDGRLTNADYVVEFLKDEQLKVSYAQLRHPITNALVQDEVPIREVRAIWDARKRLASLTNAQVTSQRDFDSSADSGRHIFTWIDLDRDGKVDANEKIDFVADQFAQFDGSESSVDMARFLGLDSSSGADDDAIETLASELVNYVRGVDRAGWRNRTIDLDDGDGAQTLRLGDMIHSAPLVVGAPSENYDLVYDDDTYRAFKQRYQNRRQVVYVGANDGMLHAFNAGFFNAATSGFELQRDGEVEHPLGSELWAYVPYNLLPHLQWLKDLEYPHVYYVDGSPQAFDVNIFPNDADHPNGWGTILVVGFRLGGGDITIDPDSDLDGDASDDITMRSAYVVFDITNPEKEPELLAEISHPELGFTTGVPTVVKRRVGSGGGFVSTSANQWYLLFGSGPAGTDATSKRVALRDAVSNQQARMFVYDLNRRELLDFDADTDGVQPALIAGQNNAFVGSMVGMDWNRDYQDEVVYFGTVSGSVSDPTGDLMRLIMPSSYNFGSPNFVKVLTGNSTGQPFSAPPLPVRDRLGQAWIYAGTGRFFTEADVLSAKQMTYYGIKEPLANGEIDLGTSVAKNDLVDVTGVRVFQNWSVQDSSGGTLTINGQTVAQFPELVRAMQNGDGWYMDFDDISTRFVDRTLVTRDTLIFVDYTASNDSCDPQGNSRLYAISMLTGTALPYAPLGLAESGPPGLVATSVDLGFGQYFLSGLHTSADGTTTVITTGSSADLEGTQLSGAPTQSGRMSWRELPVE